MFKSVLKREVLPLDYWISSMFLGCIILNFWLFEYISTCPFYCMFVSVGFPGNFEKSSLISNKTTNFHFA